MRLLPLMLLCACAAPADKTETGGADPADKTPEPATFAQVRDEVLVLSCGFGSCHGDGEAGLQIDEDMAQDALVGVPSTVLPEETLVIPGDADGSYIIAKMEAASGIAGDVMPPSGALSAERIGIVRDWIESGAK